MWYAAFKILKQPLYGFSPNCYCINNTSWPGYHGSSPGRLTGAVGIGCCAFGLKTKIDKNFFPNQKIENGCSQIVDKYENAR